VRNISLHPDTIAEIKDKVELVDVVSEYVVLQKKGHDLLGLCPFHDEKTPSFSVNPSKQLYYCFGCGAGGGAIKFLMEINKQSFKDVVLDLASRYQVPIKTLAEEDQQKIQKQISTGEQLYEILAVATSFYQHSLAKEEGTNALKYLKDQRNLSPDNIEKFKLGYAPDGWDTLYHYLVEVKHYPVTLVEQTGLIRKRTKGEGYIDYFRNRLMIPIQDANGKIIAFGARSLDGNEPKYLNSPDTPLFSKSQTLYGLNFAKKTIAQEDKVIVVEGYFDAIALHENGVSNAVAVLGTALTQKHIKLLSRYSESKTIIVNFDADIAGVKATERVIKEVESLVYSGQINLKVLTIPNGKDADEFLKSSPDSITKYRELIKNSPLWLDWEIEQIINNRNLQNSSDYNLAFQSILKLLTKISNESTKDFYLTRCAETLSTKRSQYSGLNSQEFKSIRQNLQFSLKKNYHNPYNNKKSSKVDGKSSQNKEVEKAEFLLLLIYLHCPDYREIIVNELDDKDLVFSIKYYRFLWQEINLVLENLTENNTHNNLLITVQENIVNHPDLAEKLTNIFHLSENDEQILFQPADYIQRQIALLQTIKLEKYNQYCQQQMSQLNQEKDFIKMTYYYEEFKATEAKLYELNPQRIQ